MSPEVLGNYITGRQQFRKVKVDRWLSFVFYLEKNVYKMIIFMLICSTNLYRYMKTLKNDVHNLSCKIYCEFCHSIVYIANEGCHIRI